MTFCILLEGCMDMDVFRWKSLATTGNPPPKRFAFGYKNGTTSFLCVIAEGSVEGSYCLHQLDLTALSWTRKEIIVLDESIVRQLQIYSLWFYPWSAVIASRCAHLFLSKGRIHLILDQSTLELSSVKEQEELPPLWNRVIWTYSDDVFLLGKGEGPSENKSIVFRFDSEEMKFKEIGYIADPHPIYNSEYSSITDGTRSVFIPEYKPGRNHVETIHILEQEPTLFDLAALALQKDRRRCRLARSSLPPSIIKELIARRVITEGDDEDEEGIEAKRPRVESIISTRAATRWRNRMNQIANGE